jgi:hypothetical protein
LFLTFFVGDDLENCGFAKYICNLINFVVLIPILHNISLALTNLCDSPAYFLMALQLLHVLWPLSVAVLMIFMEGEHLSPTMAEACFF